MSELERPWIAYKVLAAGAIHPKAGFRYAFENGADFALVGMFDFQVAENVAITRDILKGLNRERAWMA
jgi:NAD(P)H-dependent flavin oxidoreductase YrpB (nitropropane dioxygenase family)